MGVKGLWSLLNPVARPVQLESLEGKRLAIDSSIWLYQFQATMRDKDGRVLVNAHVLGFLRRINKLLFHGIKPIFVFDGGAPVLKRNTIAERKKRKAGAVQNHAKMAEKLFAAQMRREAVKAAQAVEEQRAARAAQRTNYDTEVGDIIPDNITYLDELEGRPGPSRPVPIQPATTSAPETDAEKRRKQFRNHDPYRLPETVMPTVSTDARPDARLATEAELQEFIDEMRPDDIDIESAEFRALPTEVQYEIIGDLRIRSRQQSHKRLADMLRAAPTALDFSRAQIKHLSQRNALTQQLLTVTDMVGQAHLTIPIRIAAERNREYVLVKRGEEDGGGWALGIREGTKEKPIVLDDDEAKKGSDSDGDDSDHDDDVEPVEPPPAADDLRKMRRQETLQAIMNRYAPKPARKRAASPDRPRRRHDQEPLFDPLPTPTANDEALALALQQEELGSDEDEADPELAMALAASRREKERSESQGGEDSGDDSDESMEEVSLVPSGRSTPVRFDSMSTIGSELDNAHDVQDDDEFEVVGIAPPTATDMGKMAQLRQDSLSRPIETSRDDSDGGFEIVETPATPDPPTDSISASTPVDEEATRRVVPAPQPDAPAVPSLLPAAGRVGIDMPPPQPQPALSPPVGRPVAPAAATSAPRPVLSRPQASEPRRLPVAPPKPPTKPASPVRKPSASLPAPRPRPEPSPLRASISADNIPSSDPPVEEPASLVQLADSGPPLNRSPSPIAEPRRAPSPEWASDHEESRSIEWSRSPSPARRPTLETGDSGSIALSEREDGADREDADMAPEDVVAESDDYARFIAQIKGRDLNEVRTEIDDEIRVLHSAAKVAARDSDEITQAMVAQIQTLLRHFGIPYITAPMEAEAQCAKLAELGLVDGIITDDSDVFLFGGTQCFKNIFNDAKYAECFLAADVERELSLSRERLITLAYLLGSDYTIGLPGVGPVVALELLANFPGPRGIERFKEWWMRVQRGQDIETEADTKWKRSFKKRFSGSIFITADWPNHLVREAYLYPQTDESDEPFHWGFPRLAALRTFLHEELSWSISKVDDELTPIVQRIARRGRAGALNVQSTLDPFFDAAVARGNYAPRRRTTANVSKRLMAVIKQFREAEARVAGVADAAWGEMMQGVDEEDPKGRKRRETTDAEDEAKPKRRRRGTASTVAASDDGSVVSDGPKPKRARGKGKARAREVEA
ncbi:DNA repair protein rad2 [Cryptotrichosporon argae]